MTGTKEANLLNRLIFVFFVLFVCLFSPVPAKAKTSLSALNFNLPQNTVSCPIAAAKAADGRYFICDAIKNHIAVLDTDYTPLFTFKKNLSLPLDIALSDASVFVLDETAHKIIIYDYNGKYQRALGLQGVSAGQFYQPCALVYDDGRLYVADTGNNRIQIFDADTLELQGIFAIEENGTDVVMPSGLAIIGDTLYTVESGGAKIGAYDKISGEPLDISLSRSAARNVDITALDGGLVVSSPAEMSLDYYDAGLNFSKSLTLPNRAYQLSVTSSGHILACGSTSRTGEGLLYDIAPDDTISTIPGSRTGFSNPQALATDDAGNVYIADTGNQRVMVFDDKLSLQKTLSDIPQPVDIQTMNGFQYVLEASAPAILVYDSTANLINSIDISFTINPARFALVDETQALICGSSDLYLVDFSGSVPTFQSLSRELIDTPMDVTLHEDTIYLLNSPNGDILYMPLYGDSAYSVSLASLGPAPTDAAALSLTSDGTIYLADSTGSKLYAYQYNFTFNQTIATEDFDLSAPVSLFSKGNDLYLCFSAQGAFAKLTHPVATGDYYITLDEEKLDDFDKTITVYSAKFGADEECVDIDCVASSDYTIKGDIGRYLLFYGLNTFKISVNDGESITDYILYITRQYPEGFTVENLDDYFAYTKSKSAGATETDTTKTNEKNKGKATILLDIADLNIDGLTITSFSKSATASVEGGQIRIVLTDSDDESPPVVQIASGDGLVTLSAEALNRMIIQKRNQYLLYAVLTGVGVILLIYFFLEYLKKHPGKRNYKRIKK